jgi:restriction endonuclease S subunit
VKAKIRDIATIRHGVYIKPIVGAELPYLQAKHFSDNGVFLNNVDSWVADLNKKNILKEGDVLFTSKGFRYFATVIDKKTTGAIASSIFFIIKPKTDEILSEFLEVTLNTPNSKAYFNQLAAGHTIPSIRKDEVLDYEISIPTLQNQKKVVEFNKLFKQEITLTSQLLEQKQKLYIETLFKIIDNV